MGDSGSGRLGAVHAVDEEVRVEVPLLPFALGAILATFALAVLGWWIASRVERRRRTARRTAETNRSWEQQGARRPPEPPRPA